MSVLSVLTDWPVGTAAAAVVGPDGVLDSYGPSAPEFALASVTKPLSVFAIHVAG